MITKNNWLNTNIKDRLHDKYCDFAVSITPYNFNVLDFNTAVDITLDEILSTYNNKPVYLSLSGGSDSLYLLTKLNTLGVNFIPIIVKCGILNIVEYTRAIDVCTLLQMVPTVLEITEKELIKDFKNILFDKIGGSGYNSTYSVIIAKHLENTCPDALLLTGVEILGGHGHTPISENGLLLINEWDDYLYAVSPITTIHPLTYSIETVYASIPNSVVSRWDTYKSKLYNLPHRTKSFTTHSKEGSAILNYLVNELNSHNVVRHVYYGRLDVNKYFTKYV